MKRFAALAAGAAVVIGTAGAVWSPAGGAEPAPVGYTVVDGDEGCSLATVALTGPDAGQVHDLPAPASPGACADDLATAPDGTVWGLVRTRPGVALVRFAADGTPSATPLVVAGDPSAYLGGLPAALAVTADGTVVATLFSDTEACAPAPIGTLDSDSSCTFTLDPATGTATPLGPTGAEGEAPFALTACGDGVWALIETGGADPITTRLGELDLTTGEVGDGPTLDVTYAVGVACAPGGDVLHSLALPPSVGLAPDAFGRFTSVGTLDPATGAFAATAPVEPADAWLQGLAVVAAPVPPPPSTTTTTAAPATTSTTAAGTSPATVTPRFTG